MKGRFQVRSIRRNALEGAFALFVDARNYADELHANFGDLYRIADTHLPEAPSDDLTVWRQAPKEVSR